MRLIDLFDHFLFDLDGCIYLSHQVIPSAPEVLAELRRLGKGVLFLTNDPSRSRQSYATKLRRLGIAAEPEEILSSGWATAAYVREHHDLDGKTAFVVGSPDFKDEVRAVGLRIVEGDDARRAHFVLVGSHVDFDYREMSLASLAVQNGAIFYATNRDSSFPTLEGHLPATGAVLASIEVASGRTAIAIGKPEPKMIDVARSLLGPGRMVMVGDRLDSDIAGGKNAGIATVLVLTGVTSREHLDATEWPPDHVLDDVGGLIRTED